VFYLPASFLPRRDKTPLLGEIKIIFIWHWDCYEPEQTNRKEMVHEFWTRLWALGAGDSKHLIVLVFTITIEALHI
jgi:hypothetical protein